MGDHRLADELVAASTPRFSPVRAWGAAALLVGVWLWRGQGEVSPSSVATAIVGAGLVAALVTGRSWARVLLLGYSVWAALEVLPAWVHTHPAVHRGIDASIDAGRADAHWSVGITCLIYAAATMLLAPWRRRELSRHGCALALIAFAFSCAWRLSLGTDAMGDVAFLSAALAAIGGVRRARWAGVLGIVAAVALVVSVTQWWWTFHWFAGHEGYSLEICVSPVLCNALRVGVVALLYGAALTALLGAFLGWQRSPPLTADVGADTGPVAPDMRRRWSILFACAMTCLIAMSWTSGGFDALRDRGIPVVGICLCAAIGVWCAMANVRRRWPAVVAVVASVPLVSEVRDRLPFLSEWLEARGAAGALLLITSLAVPIAALVVAVRRPTSLPPIPLAHRL